MKIIVHPAVEPERLKALTAAAPRAVWINAVDRRTALAEIADAEALLGKIDLELLAAAKKLRWVQAFTASLEHYMFPELIEHPCVLTNTRGLFGDVIADQTLGYVICFARNLHTYIRRQIDRRYEPVGGETERVNNATGPGTINGMDRSVIHLANASIGIVGFGGIGGEVARRALAFGMKVRAVDRFPDRAASVPGIEYLAGLDRLTDLISTSDFVVIAAPHTPETERMFDRSLFEKFKPTGYLINVGRGAIVVLDDLVTALKERKLAGAALDVYEIEPLPRDHPLWDMPNVILTPHTAGYSPAIAARHLAVLVENVGRFARGEALINIVNKSLWC